MDRKYQVFVSSTFKDLEKERFAVMQCLLDNNCIPVGMEQFHGVPTDQWKYITKMLDNSDYYVLILAGKYGTIEEESGLSYTEKEFDYAVDNNIPVIRLVYEDLGNLTANKLESTDENKKRLLAFRKKVLRSQSDFYKNVDDLKFRVVTSLNKATQECPKNGWVRYDQLQKEIATNADLQKRIEELERQVRAGSEGAFTQEDVADVFRDDDVNLPEKKIRQIVGDEINARTATNEEFNAMLDEVGL